ncbi:MAG TPA: host-nuclease inhibitor Gam family protein [Sphingomicrobium sp.]|jgi:hypothetical protein|nr:host-nuclease inhibitor Gam family protein [Sphingomicrobium sp.]
MSAVPRSLPAATRLLERLADLDGQIAAVEEVRSRETARVNADADAEAAPLVKEREAIAAALEPWWHAEGPDLAKGKKSMEIAGCLIGLRLSRPKLSHGFESDDKATEALRGTRWARQTTRVKYSLDRTATVKLLQLGGKAGADLSSLGFSVAQEDAFFVERAA